MGRCSYFLRDSISTKFTEINNTSNLGAELHFEISSLRLDVGKLLIIGGLYCLPASNPDQTYSLVINLYKFLHKYSTNRNKCLKLRDININNLNISDPTVIKVHHLFAQFWIKTFDLPCTQDNSVFRNKYWLLQYWPITWNCHDWNTQKSSIRPQWYTLYTH